MTDGPQRSVWTLAPDTPEKAQALYRLLRREIRREVVGHAAAVDRLALLAARHVARDRRQTQPLLRALLVGEDGVGKRHVARVMADVLGLPFAEIHAASLAELNWTGADIADQMGAFADAVLTRHPPPVGRELLERSVVLIEGVDLLRLPGRYGTQTGREYQRGRQQSLVQVVGDGTVAIERSGGRTLTWPSRRALVICAAEFQGLDPAELGAAGLVEWGMIPELARRLVEGAVIALGPLPAREVAEVLRRRLGELEDTFESFGYRLRISDGAVAYAAARALKDGAGAGAAAPAAWISDAAQRVLVNLLNEAAREGTTHVMTPDDIRVPAAVRGRWRE